MGFSLVDMMLYPIVLLQTTLELVLLKQSFYFFVFQIFFRILQVNFQHDLIFLKLFMGVRSLL